MRLATIAGWMIVLCSSSAVGAQDDGPITLGPEKCKKCHEAEHGIWAQTLHATKYRTIPKSPHAYKVLRWVKGGKSMKKSHFCNLCHFTLVTRRKGSVPKARHGVSCESCHGPAEEWLLVHTDFGEGVSGPEDETPAHREERRRKMREAGMITSDMHYDIAENCMTCHGLANPKLDPDTLAIMLDAKHPLNPDFELVKYSQGSVRHRFYPPDLSVNQEMSPQQLARFFILGQAAKLVSAHGVAEKSTHPTYKAAQRKRADDAKAAIGSVKHIAEAVALIGAPTEENARKLVEVIQGMDLTAYVAPFLPPTGSYK